LLKRLLAVLIAVLMLVLSCSCNGNIDNNHSNNSNNSGNNDSSDKNSASSIDKAKAQVELLLPTYKPARQIYSVDITEQDMDTVVFLRQLQGLVSKNETASIYLISNDADKYWLDYLCDELGAYSTEITVEQLVALYENFIKTIVVYSSQCNEFSFAWNDAIRREDAVCVEYSVADKFELLNNREIISICGIFTDEKASYESVFGMIEADSSQRVFMSLDSDSEFIDYAYACNAFALPACVDEWSVEFVRQQLANRSCDDLGIVFTDESVNNNVLSMYSTFGFGNIPVNEFANSTVFSSISIDYRFEKPKVHNSVAKKGNMYISLIVDCINAGDILNNGYLICNAKREDYCVAFEYPLFMSRLAPATLLWYSVNSSQKGDSLIPDGDWLNVDRSVLSDDLYKLWISVNSYLINQCGMGVAVTDTILSDDNNEYLSLQSVDGIIYYSSESLSGIYSSSKKPVLLAQRLDELSALETSLNTIDIDKSYPLYFIYSLPSSEYFKKLPIYDVHNGYYGVGSPEGYYTITEIMALFLSNTESASFVSPLQIVSYIKRS